MLHTTHTIANYNYKVRIIKLQLHTSILHCYIVTVTYCILQTTYYKIHCSVTYTTYITHTTYTTHITYYCESYEFVACTYCFTINLYYILHNTYFVAKLRVYNAMGMFTILPFSNNLTII